MVLTRCDELCGVCTVAQLREPFSAVRFLAERLPLPLIYGLKPVPRALSQAANGGSAAEAAADDLFAALDQQRNGPAGGVWSAWDICESLALAKGYKMAAGR
jgi:hypothetical protein